MTAKKDPNLTKREALIKAWKDRETYKGYDKTPGSMYNSWRAKVYTLKGREIGFPDSWKTFKGFEEEMSEGWFKGAILTRIDQTLPYSRENCVWAKKGSEVRETTTLEYNGETKLLSEWSKELGIPMTGICKRFYSKNYSTPEEILFGKPRKKRGEIQDINSLLGRQQKRDKISKMLSAYKIKDKKKGYENDLTKDFLEEILSKPCYYCRDTYRIGLDRIDNSKGHTQDNVVPCCIECNTVRNNLFSVEEMLILGKTIKAIKDERNKKRRT